MEPLLKCDHLAVGHDGIALSVPMSFSVYNGDYLCVLGVNGNGKTTFLNTILGITPKISGIITYEKGLTTRDIGYLPQQTDEKLGFPSTVEDIVMQGCFSRIGRKPLFTAKYKKIARKSMEPRDHGALGQALQGPFRRPAAESTHSKSLLRDRKAHGAR